MSNILTSSRLIKSIKRRAMIPSDQDTFETEDFLDMLNEEIQYFGVEHLLSTYEEYLVTYVDFDLDPDITEFEIPARAVGNKLRGLFYVDNSGNLFDLHRVNLKDMPTYNNNIISNTTSVFHVQGNKIVLANQLPFTNGSLRMYFYLKPNKLVDEERVGTITAINTTTGEITLDSVPDGFSNLPDMDFVQVNSPNRILAYDKTPSAIDVNTKVITFSPSDLPSELAVGDYVNFAYECVVPQLPSELHPVLAQRVAVAALEALGDADGQARAQARLDAMEKSTLSIIDNRVESAVEKIKNRNGPLRESSRYTRRGKF